MAFESLSFEYTFTIDHFPPEWLPLTYLYDPDLPLFPIQYFHLLDPMLPKGRRPGDQDRLFGFVHHVNLDGTSLHVSVVVNKDVKAARYHHYEGVLKREVMARLGLENPVSLSDVEGALTGGLAAANGLTKELWYQVIDGSFGKVLPFGRMWDAVFGLVRFVASWNSDGGRKGELIQTHCFASEFGVKIQTAGGINVDFFLLPTFEEMTDGDNPLSHYPQFALLVQAADEFSDRYCDVVSIGSSRFSAFRRTKATSRKRLDTAAVVEINAKASARFHKALLDSYSAFNRGPQRSVLFLMMLHDLRHGYWNASALSADECGELYRKLTATYQSPKVISLYAQQCAGNEQVLPLDLWVKTFLSWPFDFRSSKPNKYYAELFASSAKWGKLERLIWVAAQARKVHSSVCKEILWCVRFGAPDQTMRGANPFACKICEGHIRKICPSFGRIAGSLVGFNTRRKKGITFRLSTSLGNNTASGQNFESCAGVAEKTKDTYSVRDRPESFKVFPQAGHDGSQMTVQQFIQKY